MIRVGHGWREGHVLIGLPEGTTYAATSLVFLDGGMHPIAGLGDKLSSHGREWHFLCIVERDDGQSYLGSDTNLIAVRTLMCECPSLKAGHVAGDVFSAAGVRSSLGLFLQGSPGDAKLPGHESNPGASAICFASAFFVSEPCESLCQPLGDGHER